MNLRAQMISRARQLANELACVNRSSRNLSNDAQRAGIRPGNRRVWARTASPNFPRPTKVEIALHSEFRDRLAKAAQNVAQPRKITCGGFRQDHTAGIPAGSRADLLRFEYAYGFIQRQVTQPGRGCEACKSAADYSEIDFLGKSGR